MTQAMSIILPMVFFLLLDMIVFANTYGNRIEGYRDRMFRRFEIVVIVQQLAAIVMYAHDYNLFDVPNGIMYVINIYGVTGMTAAFFFWFRYLLLTISERSKERAIHRILQALPTLFMLVVCILSYWTGWVFQVDENGTHHTGSLSGLEILCPYIYLVMATVFVVLELKRGKMAMLGKIVRNFVVFLVPAAVGALLQLRVLRGGYTQIGISFGMVLLYLNMYIEDLGEMKRLKIVDQMNLQLQAMTEAQNQQLKLVNTLSQNYLNVYVIKPKTRTLTILKLDGYVTAGLSMEGAPEYPYDATCQKYISDRVYSEDVEMMKQVMDLHNIEEALYAGRDYVGTYRIADGNEIHYYQYNYVRIENSDEIIAGFQNVDTMIANEKEQRDRLQEALDSAKRANEAKSSFLARMSHDIRTPLNGIMGMIAINDQHPEDAELNRENRAKAMVAANHLLALISDVLDLSKLESEDVQPVKEPVDLRELCKDVLSIMELQCNEMGLELTHDDSEARDPYPYIWGNSLQLRQILLNIIGNAVKYNKPGGSIHCHMKMLAVDDRQVTYRTTITDTGIGMSEEYLQHLFEPFTQENVGARSKFQGTGLGMAIVKKLVESMNGTIDVTSKQGEGTCITITITFERASEADVHKKDTVEEVSLVGKKVLIAEDNELNMEIAKMLIADLGAEVTEAVNGEEAVAAFTAAAPGSFDLILMDLMMPVMDGLEATAAIRSSEYPEAKTIPIVAMSANAFSEDVKRCLDAGMNAHLAKPISVPKMKETLAQVFAQQ